MKENELGQWPVVAESLHNGKHENRVSTGKVKFKDCFNVAFRPNCAQITTENLLVIRKHIQK